MPETSKNKWVAIVVAVVIVALFFGGFFLYSFNREVAESVANMGATSTVPVMQDTATSTLIKPLNATTTQTTKRMNTTTTPEGLVIEDIRVGTGDVATPGQNVAVHYTGTLQNGTKFDSSVDRGQPFVFPLGAGRVIKGWDQGVAGMKVGGKRRLVIPASLAYGAQSPSPAIPPNSTLIFEVELLGIQK